MKYTDLYFELLNNEFASKNLKLEYNLDTNKNKRVVDLPNLKINVGTNYGYTLTNLNGDNRFRYNYYSVDLSVRSEVRDFVRTMMRQARIKLASSIANRSKVFKLKDAFYVLSEHRYDSERKDLYRINTKYTSVQSNIDALRILLTTMGTDIVLDDYEYYVLKDNEFDQLDEIEPVYTKAFEIAEINHFKVADADKNAVHVVRRGVNYGKFWLTESELALFERCKVSGYLTTALANFFNERINHHTATPNHFVTTSMVSSTLPVCDACNVKDLSQLYDDQEKTSISFRGNSVLCDECARKVTDAGIDLTSYHAKKFVVGGYNSNPMKLNFAKYDSENTPLYMGVEVEVDTSTRNMDDEDDEEYMDDECHYDSYEHSEFSNYALHIIGGGKDVIFSKTDGSLNNGFEIVSHPMTLARHTRTMQWQKGMDLLTKSGYKSHNTSTCGLHIHINRDFFGSKSVQSINGAKIAYLMEKNVRDFVNFSRRRQGELDRWARFGNMVDRLSPQVSPRTKSMLSSAFRSNYSSRNKYVALNTIHASTFEFRIFKGTLNYATFLATMQLVDNLARIVKDIPNNDTMFEALDKIKFDDIVNYRPYAELTAYWEKRKAV
jgi:hypothetical protein